MAYAVNRIVIKRNHTLYPYCMDVCQKSKNIYNAALFQLRQVFASKGKTNLHPLQLEAKRQ